MINSCRFKIHQADSPFISSKSPKQMKTATGHAVRPKLANNIVRIAMEDEAYGYVGTIKKVTVLRHGLSNISEHSPYDYYCLTKDSVFKE